MTSELPEMRASDSERERVAERLREAVAEGRLDMDEFGQRLDAAYKARTHGELAPLVRDLPVGGSVPGAAAAPATGDWAGRVGGPATSKGAFAFWGGFGRKGTWTVGRRFTAFTLMGGGELDLREARFEAGETVINCVALMGGVHIVVPPDLNVEIRGIGLMGGFGEGDSGVEGTPDPSAPRVIIKGLALMGGVGVERKRTRAEKQRLKAERAQKAEQLDSRDQGRLDKGEGEGGGRKELG
ncbi:DUF1707 domain-containing protein [Streptomyces sp. NPDC002889]|uniref:DUF1707 SHOCT-like domain-containing protein n=1 Tax=Streptomyces sp. NPDC002889 TaxID=3364669 RepID=UPI003692F3E7